MPLPCFTELFAAADARQTPAPVVAAGGADSTVIQALELARRRGWIEPILTGPTAAIRERADALEIDLEPFSLIEDESDSAVEAVAAVKSGRAELLMKGQISTPQLMQAILDKQRGLRTGKVICQVVLMEIRKDQRTFLLTDTGVTISPTMEQKQQLLEHVVKVARRLGCEAPRAALMSATEKVVQALPDTLDAQQLVELSSTGVFGACHVQGPLSFDLAYAADAGAKKGIKGAVTGAADAMVFPDLLSANLTVKSMMYTADCQFGGILQGTSTPVVFMSRADSVETRLNSLAFALRILGE